MRNQLPAPVLRSPHHLMAAIPFLLGFAPRASVVLVWIDSGTIALTQRVDWPGPADAAELNAWSAAVVRAAQHVSAQDVVLLGYPGPGPAEHRHDDAAGGLDADVAPLVAVASAVRCTESELLDALVVFEDDWCALDPQSPASVMPILPFDPQITAEVSDDFIYAGWTYAHDRAEVCAEFEASPTAPQIDSWELDLLASQVHDHTGRQLEAWRDEAVHLLIAFLQGQAMETGGLAGLAVALTDIRVRDAVLWHLAHELDAGCSLTPVQALVRVLPVGHRAPAATVASICAWLSGDGVRASAALDVAVEDQPDYGLALLVSKALTHGLPPRMWLETMQHLSYDDCRHGLR